MKDKMTKHPFDLKNIPVAYRNACIGFTVYMISAASPVLAIEATDLSNNDLANGEGVEEVIDRSANLAQLLTTLIQVLCGTTGIGLVAFGCFVIYQINNDEARGKGWGTVAGCFAAGAILLGVVAFAQRISNSLLGAA